MKLEICIRYYTIKPLFEICRTYGLAIVMLHDFSSICNTFHELSNNEVTLCYCQCTILCRLIVGAMSVKFHSTFHASPTTTTTDVSGMLFAMQSRAQCPPVTLFNEALYWSGDYLFSYSPCTCPVTFYLGSNNRLLCCSVSRFHILLLVGAFFYSLFLLFCYPSHP